MSIEKLPGGSIVITGEQDIAWVRILALRGALWLETKGLRHSHGSVYAMVKREFNLKGSKRRVYEQFCRMHDLPTQEEYDAEERRNREARASAVQL